MFACYVLLALTPLLNIAAEPLVSSKCSYQRMSMGPADEDEIVKFDQVQIQAACLIKCDRNTDCKSFVYNNVDKSCVLYSSADGVQSLTEYQNAVKRQDQCEIKYCKYCFK
jgi:hypothetical protein